MYVIYIYFPMSPNTTCDAHARMINLSITDPVLRFDPYRRAAGSYRKTPARKHLSIGTMDCNLRFLL